MSAQCPLCPKGDMLGRFPSTRPRELPRLASAHIKLEGPVLVVEFDLPETKGDALGRRVAVLRRRYVHRRHDHVAHLEQQEFAAGLAGPARGEGAVRNMFARGAEQEQQWGCEVDQLLDRDVLDLHTAGAATAASRRAALLREPPAPGQHVDLALMLGVGRLAVDARKLEKHIDRHGIASLAGTRREPPGTIDDTILRARSQATRTLRATPVARMTDS